MKTAFHASDLPDARVRSGNSGGHGRCGWPVLVLILVAVGAASASCGGSRAGLAQGDSTRITEQELSALTVTNAYDAVAQLRPLWLRSRGRRSSRLPTEIVVAQNSSYFGPLSSLREFRVSELKSLRYLDGTQAGALSGLGSRAVEGAIVIELR